MANANQITTQRPAIFTRVRDMGLFVVIVCFGLAALFLEALYRLALTALFWTPPLFCGVWAMQATAALHRRIASGEAP